MADEILVPKDKKILVANTKTESFLKLATAFIMGCAGLFGWQKMPTINESTKISEAVQTVENLSPTQLAALQGMQYVALEKRMNEKHEATIAAISKMETQLTSQLKEYDERTSRRLDKYSDRLLTNEKDIAYIKAFIPKSRN